MNGSDTVVVVGLGEVGKPLLELVSKHHKAVGVDVSAAAEPIQRVEGRVFATHAKREPIGSRVP
jgi:hypothetical protein